MSARRNKNQARRTGGGNGTPGWVWLAIGVVIGAVLLFTVPGLLKKDGDGFFRPTPNPDAKPAPVAESDDDAGAGDATAAKPASAAAPAKETQYDFYTLLPGKETRISDAQLAADARAEQARQQQVAAAQAAANDKAAPKPLDESASRQPNGGSGADAAAELAKPAQPAPANAAAARTVASAAPASGNASYILQAGAFGASGDAEATKARIALLGLSARVESAQIGGKTVYRVRMGPYGSASELAAAKQKLANGGLPAMAIKAQ
jgi:cell division protein FtsN